MPEAAWWRGTRGEWYVVAQVALILLILLGPRSWRGWPATPFPDGWIVWSVGMALILGGAGLAAAGGRRLGRALTPLPYPAERAVLQQTGAYGFVRHPMYSGVLLAGVGWALVSRGWLTFVYVAAAFALIDLKVRREEAWLRDRFPGYRAYQGRVRKLVPFVY